MRVGYTKNTVYFESKHESGNIYYILALVCKAIGKEQAKECIKAVKDSAKSYEEALDIIRDYVTLVDIDGVY